MVASGAKESNSFNPFAVGSADAIAEMLTSQLGEEASGDTNQVFRDHAVALVGTMAPVLVWMRDHKGVALNIDTIRSSFELRCIWKIAMKKTFEVRDPATGEVLCIRRGSLFPYMDSCNISISLGMSWIAFAY